MNGIFALKGPERRLISLLQDNNQGVHLVGYADGSLGIIKDNRTIGVWEHEEQDACITAFVQIARNQDRLRDLLLLMRNDDEPCADKLSRTFVN